MHKVIIGVFLLILALLVFGVAWLLWRFKWKPLRFLSVAWVTFCLFVITYGATLGTTHFQVNEVEYSSSRLPRSFDGYRVLQISDLHIGSWKGREEAIRQLVQLVNEQQADLILFTGDLVNSKSDELEAFIPILSQLSAPDGVYSVLGNHDYGDYYRWPTDEAKRQNLQHLIDLQGEMGWTLLNNASATLHHGTDSIALIGVENDGEPPFPQHADLPKALQGTDGMFKLLMSHNPTHWRREVLPQTDIDLMLAGHTHAMQSILFGRSLAELKYDEWRGFYYEADRALYVNIGIGFVGFPFRFGAWPEITVITMKSEE